MAKRKKRVLLDLDNTINDFSEQLLEIYNFRHGTKFTPDDITDYDFINLGPTKQFADIWNEPGFFSNLKPLPGAVQFVKELHEHFEVLTVTAAPSEAARAEKIDWLIKHFNYGTKELQNTHFARNKQIFRVDFVIDDSPEVLEAFAAEAPKTKLYSWHFPYSPDYDRLLDNFGVTVDYCLRPTPLDEEMWGGGSKCWDSIWTRLLNLLRDNK